MKNQFERIEKLQLRMAQNNNPPILMAVPKQVQELLVDAADAYGINIKFLLAAFLSAAATAIGNTHRARFLWEDGLTFFFILEGPPGSKKSHAIDWAFYSVNQYDDFLNKVYQEHLRIYNQQMASLKTGEPIPEKPRPKAYIIGDATVEAITKGLENNDRGIGIVADEIATQFKTMGKGKKILNTIWSGKQFNTDRKTTGITRVYKTSLNLIGTSQPGITSAIFKNGQMMVDGSLDRFLFENPKVITKHKMKAISQEAISGLHNRRDQIFKQLLRFEPWRDEDGKIIPVLLPFSEEAEQEMLSYINKDNNASHDYDLDEEIVERIAAKMQTYAVRFALLLQLLKSTCEEGGKDCIDLDSTKKAILLAEHYKSNAFAIWENLSRKNPFDRLPQNKQEVYIKLPNSFKPSDVLDRVTPIISKRTFYYWLASDDKLFKKVSHGTYKKTLQEYQEDKNESKHFTKSAKKK